MMTYYIVEVYRMNKPNISHILNNTKIILYPDKKLYPIIYFN